MNLHVVNPTDTPAPGLWCIGCCDEHPAPTHCGDCGRPEPPGETSGYYFCSDCAEKLGELYDAPESEHPTPRRYQVDDEVRLPDSCLMGTVVALVDDAHPRAYAARAAGGIGPLYLVNDGNHFAEEYEGVYAESELTPWAAA